MGNAADVGPIDRAHPGTGVRERRQRCLEGDRDAGGLRRHRVPARGAVGNRVDDRGRGAGGTSRLGDGGDLLGPSSPRLGTGGWEPSRGGGMWSYRVARGRHAHGSPGVHHPCAARWTVWGRDRRPRHFRRPLGSGRMEGGSPSGRIAGSLAGADGGALSPDPDRVPPFRALLRVSRAAGAGLRRSDGRRGHGHLEGARRHRRRRLPAAGRAA